MKKFNEAAIREALKLSTLQWQRISGEFQSKLPTDFSQDLPRFFYCRQNAYDAISLSKSSDLLAWAAIVHFWRPNDTLQPFLIDVANTSSSMPDVLGLALRSLNSFGYIDVSTQTTHESLRQIEPNARRDALALDMRKVAARITELPQETLGLIEHVGKAALASMMSSPESCRERLSSADSKLRFSALAVMEMHFDDQITSNELLVIAESDPVAIVSCEAIRILAERCDSSDNDVIGAKLATILKRPLPHDVAQSVMDALYRLRGIPFTILTTMDQRWHVDNGFVDSFLDNIAK